MFGMIHELSMMGWVWGFGMWIKWGGYY